MALVRNSANARGTWYRAKTTQSVYDGLNTGEYENFAAFVDGDDIVAGIVKKDPPSVGASSEYAHEDGVYVTLEGADGTIVEFSNVTKNGEVVLSEVGTGTFTDGSVVYGDINSTTRMVTISSTGTAGDLILGTVVKPLITQGDNKFVQVQLRMNGRRFEVEA